MSQKGSFNPFDVDILFLKEFYKKRIKVLYLSFIEKWSKKDVDHNMGVLDYDTCIEILLFIKLTYFNCSRLKL